MDKIYPLRFAPGIKRDNTVFDGDACPDGSWVRWVGGRPRKMLGYRNIANDFSGIASGCHGFSQNGYLYVHAGSPSALERKQFDNNAAGAGIVSRTPSGYASDETNIWTFDDIFDEGSSGTVLVAHAAPNLVNIDQNTDMPVYYGDVVGTAQLTAIPDLEVSGGIVALPPYLFAYGSYGEVKWSVPGEITNFTGEGSGSDRITGSKIVKGLRYRGGPANSPAGLFWSLDSLIRVSFVGSTTSFRADTISDEISILAQNSVVPYDGKYFWIGADRFMMFDGTVREVPNTFNLDFFFGNLNYAQRQKIWGIKVPRFGEIWWFFPKGESLECNHAIILNVREETWYDTALDRSCGFYRQVFPFPVMFGTELDDSDKVILWQHEYGYNLVSGDSVVAIPSYFETPDISYCATGPGDTWSGVERWVSMNRLEPDFVMSGAMTVQLVGNKYAQGDVQEGGIQTFYDTTEKLSFKEQYREMRLRFTSNTAGGYYQLGQTLMTLGIGDGWQGN